MRAVDELRPPRLGRLLELWRECREIGDPLEQVLRCNGRIVSECCYFQGEPVYESGEEALEDLTGRQMETLLLRLAGGGQEDRRPSGEAENPEFDTARFQALRGE